MPKHQFRSSSVSNHEKAKNATKAKNRSNHDPDHAHLIHQLERKSLRHFIAQRKFFGKLMTYKDHVTNLKTKRQKCIKTQDHIKPVSFYSSIMCIGFALACADANSSDVQIFDGVIGFICFIIFCACCVWRYVIIRQLAKGLIPYHMACLQKQTYEFYNNYITSKRSAISEKKFLLYGTRMDTFKRMSSLERKAKYHWYLTNYMKNRDQARIADAQYRMAKAQLNHYKA